MTDCVDANYPKEGVKKLKKLQKEHPNKIFYSGIKMGAGDLVLNQISDDLKGETVLVYDFKQEDMTEKLLRSIETIQFREY